VSPAGQVTTFADGLVRPQSMACRRRRQPLRRRLRGTVDNPTTLPTTHPATACGRSRRLGIGRSTQPRKSAAAFQPGGELYITALSAARPAFCASRRMAASTPFARGFLRRSVWPSTWLATSMSPTTGTTVLCASPAFRGAPSRARSVMPRAGNRWPGRDWRWSPARQWYWVRTNGRGRRRLRLSPRLGPTPSRPRHPLTRASSSKSLCRQTSQSRWISGAHALAAVGVPAAHRAKRRHPKMTVSHMELIGPVALNKRRAGVCG